MRLSARNTLAGIVRKIEVAPNLMLVSIITNDVVQGFNLKVGDRAYAVIKASSVMIGVD